MKLVWSAFSLFDRDRIYEFIESESPRNAAIVDKRIAESAELLLDFPDSGRIGRVAGTRELVILRTPYVAAYVVIGDVVRVLRILHGAQLWPDEF